MPKRARFSPVKTSQGWRLNIPAKYSLTGKRERHFYKTRAEATDAGAKLREQREQFGDQSRAIAPSLAEQATAAARLLEPLGVPLLEAVRRFVETETALRSSVLLEQAFTTFEQTKGDRSDRQTKAYSYAGKNLRSDFSGRVLASITAEELHSHIESHAGGPTAFNHRFGLVAAFWRWCAKPPREWCSLNVLETIERKEVVRNAIGVLRLKEVQALMATAEQHFPDTVAAFAIQLFTGIRKAELERLQPGDISPEGITVPATSAKIKRRRFIHMPPPLAAWLDVYPIGETVLPTNWSRKERAVRRMAGWRIWSDLVDPSDPPDELPEWPNNALRHTAATVALAIGKPIETLVFEHGHSGGLTTLRNHYIGALPKAEAEKIWALRPSIAA